MQNENRSYYKLENNNPKILDSKLMNALLLEYAQTRDQNIDWSKCKAFENNTVEEVEKWS